MMVRKACQDLFLARKCNGGCTGNPWSASEFAKLMLGQFGPGTDEAHISQEHIQELRQLIELPTAKKGADRCESLIAGSRDLVPCATLEVFHRPEFQNREIPAVKPGTLLQEQNGAPRSQ